MISCHLCGRISFIFYTIKEEHSVRINNFVPLKFYVKSTSAIYFEQFFDHQNFKFCELLHFARSEISQNQNSHRSTVSNSNFEPLHRLKLISRKIWKDPFCGELIYKLLVFVSDDEMKELARSHQPFGHNKGHKHNCPKPSCRSWWMNLHS